MPCLIFSKQIHYLYFFVQILVYFCVLKQKFMQDELSTIESTVLNDYKYGFVTDLEVDEVPKGLNEDTIRLISAKKKEPQWMLDWRLKAYRHWLKMEEPKWANVKYEP